MEKVAEPTLFTPQEVVVPGAPEIPGLSFRLFKGREDFVKLASVRNASKLADGSPEIITAERMAEAYANLKNSDYTRDLVIVEVNGEPIGYKRIEWWEEQDGTRIYGHFGELLPEWRGKGIGRALFRHSEDALLRIAATHPEGPKFFDVGAFDTSATVEMIRSMGYEPVRHFFDMVRPNLNDIPDLPLPGTLEVRAVIPKHFRAIYEAEVEAFKDHWGSPTDDENDYERWLAQPIFQPVLWQIAWDGNEVAGIIRNFINPEENQAHHRKRGYVENISVRRPWRKRGLARALIARSFKIHKDMGMEEAALGVDTENPTGALQLYESMGFRPVTRQTSFRKTL